MSPSRSARRRYTRRRLVAVAAVPVIAAAVAVPLALGGGHADRDGGRDAGAESLSGFLHDHPALRARTEPIAFLKEKVGDKGGEAGESANGPAQEQYANRAYPRTTVAQAQQVGARTAFLGSRSNLARSAHAVSPDVAAARTATWTSLGPDGAPVPGQVTYTGTPSVTAGRTTSLSVAPGCTAAACTLYAGTAGGGVWRTADALAAHPHWTPIGAGIPSNAIGVVEVDPTDHTGRTVYVGTGEPNGSGDSEAGVGLFRSTDGGATFSLVVGSAVVAKDRGIATVLVDPRRRSHLLIGTTVARHGSSNVNGGRFTPPNAPPVGLYESTDGGASFRAALVLPQDTVDPTTPTGADYFRGGVTKILADPRDPGTVYASAFAYGLFRRSLRLDGDSAWHQVFTDPFPDDRSSRTEFALTTSAGHTRVYLGNATSIPTRDATGTITAVEAGLYRTDNADRPAAALDSAKGSNRGWALLSNPKPGTRGYDSYNFCETQCSYDMVVTTPPRHPDEVFLSGSMNYNEIFTTHPPSNGRAVQRSTSGGATFTDMTVDAQPRPNGLHPDQHDLVFVPGTDQTFFSASDGGVVRQSGPFVNRSNDCLSARRGLSGTDLSDCLRWLSAVPTRNAQLNSGLDTLQFQSVSVDPHNDARLLGGTQDNGTIANAAALGANAGAAWLESVGGDGGQSGFDAANSAISYHSYYSPAHDVNFRTNDPNGWDWISDPLLNSGEAASFYTPLRVDPVVGGTVFDGLQHVWRTTDHGGPRSYLDLHCNEITGDFASTCGDWTPLGGAAGDLTAASYGDRAGQYVVAVERATTNRSTLWAATRTGRLFVSTNANAAAAAVSYTRIDSDATPGRFVSGIAIDPANPNHAWVSYSGYTAYAAGGHVYDVHYNPATHTATFRNLSLDLGDQPVTGIAYVPATGALYASTDFGVLVLPRGTTSWLATPGLPPVAVYGLTSTRDGKVLYAATHGRGVYRLSTG